MRRAVLLAAAAALLVGPFVIAFHSGGYFDRPRLVAACLAWVLVLIAALAAPQPLPRSRPAWIAVAGVALIAAWTAASIAWAPLSDVALDSLIRLLLYLGALLAALALLRDRRAARSVEPALALGAVVVIGFGLSERLLPGLVDLSQSVKSGGRLEQPITYWNSEGLLAALGVVAAGRLAGDVSRPRALRAAAAAATAVLGLGVALSFSRGAIAAAVVGLLIVVAAAPVRPQLRAAALALVAGAIAGAVGSLLPGVADVEGSLGDRKADGAIMLAVLAVVAAAAAVLQARLAAAESRDPYPRAPLPFARLLPALAGLAVAAALAVIVAGGLGERVERDELAERQGPARLASTESRRYDYWRVGLRSFADHPIRGAGPGSFRVEWLSERPVAEAAVDVHSLPLEMAADLGLPGIAGLLLLTAGVGWGGRRALRRDGALAPGLIAVPAVWLLAATIDWHWQVPAVTLPALAAAGALLAAGDEPSAPL